MKYIYLFMWLCIIIAGAGLHSLEPSSWWYTIGFCSGALSQVFLMLFLS
jgi:hypothetical protein